MSIFLTALIKSNDYKQFGNQSCLNKLTQDINFLEKKGISIKTSHSEFQVNFILALLHDIIVFCIKKKSIFNES